MTGITDLQKKWESTVDQLREENELHKTYLKMLNIHFVEILTRFPFSAEKHHFQLQEQVGEYKR